MLPLRDENPTRSVPYVNYALLLANVAVFLWQLSGEWAGASWLTATYGVVPHRLLTDVPGELFTVVTAMFMHGGLAHLGGNLLFLYIFGDNVEDAVGHGRYLGFYFFCGLAAAAAQVGVDPSSTLPMVGASGAIAGVLGAYVVLYPRAPITVLNPFFPLWFLLGPLLVFPAWLVMGEWFIWNLLPGLGSLGQVGQGGVAFFAHIGGFLAGLLLVRPMALGRQRVHQPAWSGWKRMPNQGRGGWNPPPGQGRPGDWGRRGHN